eukprot:3941631-Rhodomonas_salina.2
MSGTEVGYAATRYGPTQSRAGHAGPPGQLCPYAYRDSLCAYAYPDNAHAYACRDDICTYAYRDNVCTYVYGGSLSADVSLTL